MGADGKELWATAGNPEDTRQIIDLIPGSFWTEPPPCAAPLPGDTVSEYCRSVKIVRSADVRSLTLHGDFLYFIVSDTALIVKRFTGGPLRDFPANLVKADDKLLFMGYEEGEILLWSLPE